MTFSNMNNMENKNLFQRLLLSIKDIFCSYISQSKEKIVNTFIPKPALNEKQKAMIRIVESMVATPEAELLIAPISGTRYVKLKEIYIKIDSSVEDGTYIELINGRFSHHVGFPEKIITDDVLKIFDTATEKRRKNMEKTIWDKTSQSLDMVIKEIEQIVVENK
jgi:hypothetical protein